MSVFRTRRELRLWLWAALVVLAIYSTLGLAGTLAGSLRDRGLLDAAFVAGFVLVIATIAGAGLRLRWAGIEIWVATGVAAAFALLIVRTGISAADRTHLVEYGVVATLVHQALLERFSVNGRRWRAALLAWVITATLGSLDEVIQAFIPNRVFDPLDIGVNALAGLGAIAASVAIGWARRWRAGTSVTS